MESRYHLSIYPPDQLALPHYALICNGKSFRSYILLYSKCSFKMQPNCGDDQWLWVVK